MCAQAMPRTTTPSCLMREQFLRQLDLGNPELAAVKRALGEDDLAKAEHEFITYWRKRPLQTPRCPGYKETAMKTSALLLFSTVSPLLSATLSRADLAITDRLTPL